MVAAQALPQNKVKWMPGGICHPQWLQGLRYWRVTCKQYNFWVLWFLQPWVGSVWQNPKWVGLTPGTNEEFDLASPQCSIMTRWLLWDAGLVQLKPFVRPQANGARDPVHTGKDLWSSLQRTRWRSPDGLAFFWCVSPPPAYCSLVTLSKHPP